ncbi:MAG: M28 family peptidase [Planctomycetaceae bacterium]|nr:M28 family peptidase [Planctomycetaceae bacterium]
MLRLMMPAACLFIMLLLPAALPADDIPQLTTDQQQAMMSITEGDLLSSVSFLASDELAGRDTPSKELSIACAWVAAQFRGAGLEPLGDDDTFYHTHQFASSRPPATARLMLDGAALSVRGVLNATDERLELTADVLSRSAVADAEDPQIVVLKEQLLPPQAASRPGLVIATMSRTLRDLTSQGVKIALMKCSDQSVLLDVAAELQQKPISNRQELRPGCALILISEDTQVAGRRLTVDVAPQEIVTQQVHNVVGVLRGSDETLSREAVLITAHLDHIGTKSSGADTVNNGADDNATGVTAVVALARAYSRLSEHTGRSVIFATFWGEEKGLLGSKEFAERSPWPLSDIVANVNIEMVGRPESDAREKVWMTGWTHSNLGELMNQGASRAGVEVFNREDIGEMLYKRSDNYSFVRKGVVAHSFSGGSLHSDYHQPTDEWEKLDLPHMTKVVQGLFAGTLYVTGADVKVRGESE